MLDLKSVTSFLHIILLIFCLFVDPIPFTICVFEPITYLQQLKFLNPFYFLNLMAMDNLNH